MVLSTPVFRGLQILGENSVFSSIVSGSGGYRELERGGVMKICTGLMWLVIRYGSGFCKISKEALSCAAGRQNIQLFQINTDVSGFQ
jgi:hypothetical protein